jgi:formylglycine-generating enzyme required for sulfatase activity
MLEATWWDAYAYAKWKGRDLPSEKEWEKAARGTKGFQYPWGEKLIEKNANTGLDYAPGDPSQPGKIDGYNFWCDVDAEKDDESPFGVVGMAGNVSEWTNDWTPDNFPIIKGGNFSMPPKPLSERITKTAAGEVQEWLGFRTISHTPPSTP